MSEAANERWERAERLLDRLAVIAAPALAYTVDEAAEACRIGRTALYDAIAAGELVARKRGRSTIILRDDLDSYLKGLEVVK